MTKEVQHQDTYSGFATFYNELWSKQYVDQYGEWILEMLQQHGIGKRVLDLACGCGHLLQLLHAHGYHTHGCDASPEMLRYASVNAPGSTLQQSSFGEPLPASSYDVVVCLYDSINYCEAEEIVLATFKQVYNTLGEKGVFLLDFNTREGHWVRWNGVLPIVEKWGVCICVFSNDAESRTASVKITGFLPQEHCWRRFSEFHRQLSLEPRRVQALLRQAGFTDCKVMESELVHSRSDVGRVWMMASK